MSPSTARLGCLLFGLLNVAVGLLGVIEPGTFFAQLGSYGPRNDHYIGDLATFYLATGIGLVVAGQRPSWRVPMLTVVALWWGLHALNHARDISEAASPGRGILDTALIAGVGLALGWMAAVIARQGDADA